MPRPMPPRTWRRAHHAGLRPGGDGVAALRGGGRAGLRRRQARACGPRRAHGALPCFWSSPASSAFCGSARASVIDGEHDGRPARPVRALCRVRRRRHGASSPRCGASWRRRPAPPSGWPSCWRCGPRSASPPHPRPLPSPPLGDDRLQRRAFRLSLAPGAVRAQRRSFAVSPGETVAIVGPSGAGKSTIFNLLLRFYDPQSGEVRVDGVRASRCRPACSCATRIALVPQDVALFADTIAENIRYGGPDASDDEVVRAPPRPRRPTSFIRALPQGYETRLGERGVTLSGGQRQRIAIARAILQATPRSCCSTRRPARSTPRARRPCSGRSSA